MNPSLHSSKISLRAPEPEDIDEMMFFENDASFWENGPAVAYKAVFAEPIAPTSTKLQGRVILAFL